MTRLFSRSVSALALAGALVTGAACSDDDDSPTGPSVEQIVGTYTATRLTATTTLGTQDVLQAGGSLTMVFASSGAVTGTVVIPSESLNESFAGTWKIDDGEVEIEEVGEDIFVEDLKFTVVGNTLVADETFDNVRVQVTLTKQ